MSKEKTYINVAFLGHVDSGKSTTWSFELNPIISDTNIQIMKQKKSPFKFASMAGKLAKKMHSLKVTEATIYYSSIPKFTSVSVDIECII